MRRVAIITASGFLSLILVLATMQLVCVLLNRIFGFHLPKHNIIWLVK
jgi:hypothetical protein